MIKWMWTSVFCAAVFIAESQEYPRLEQVVSKVLEQNFNIRIERNNVELSANNNNPGNAGYLPEIALNADQNWSSNNTRQEFFSGQVNQAKGAKNKSTNAALRMNWTFFDGFNMFVTDKRLQLQEDQASLYLIAEMEMKIYQAAVLYYTIMQQQQLTPIYEQAIDLSLARYQLSELKVKNGAANQLQLIQSRLDLTADSALLLQHQKQLSDLKIDLNTLMGEAPEANLQLGGTLLFEDKLTWEQALQQAKDQNTGLLLAKSNLAISEMQRKEVQSYYYPQLGFYAQYAFASSQNQIGILNSNRSYGTGVGFTFKWTILDHLTNYTALQNNSIMIENAQLKQEQQNQFIEAELRKTFNEYLWAKQNLNMEQNSVVNAGEIFQIAEQALQNGSMTNLELREIQFSVVQAQSRLLQAQLALKTAELNISLTTGDFKKMLQ